MECVKTFYTKYFSDQRKRIFLFGINPGRFGSGLTGISFTDPVALREKCGIENQLGNKKELSSEFIYRVIDAYGGAEKFYKDFFITAVCPLGFMKGDKNFNYYDDMKLMLAVTPFIQETFSQQIELGARKEALICIGSGQNRKFIELLNQQVGYFDKIISLEHPRFIMQYKRKKLDSYIDQYLSVLNSFTGVAGLNR